jgi:hypothetical protein
MPNYGVTYSDHGYYHRDPWSEDNPFPSWEESCNVTIQGLSEKGSDLSVNFEVKPGVPYYLVYVEYSTGDSFGHSRGNPHFVELYEEMSQAEEAAKAIREDYDNDKDSYEFKPVTIPFKHSDGTVGTREESTYRWKGYFESLESIQVVPVMLGAKRF